MQSYLGTMLIHQLGLKTDSAKFSHDFNVSKSRAFYMPGSGWGHKAPFGYYYFDGNTNDFERKPREGKHPEEKICKSISSGIAQGFYKEVILQKN